MEQWSRVETLFDEAVQRPPEEREAYLRVACGGDVNLQRDIESLLRHHEREADDAWAAHAAAAVLGSRSMSLQRGEQVGPYRIDAFIASGGMGEVYRADDTRLGRIVAIKVLSRIAMTNGHALERFQREARAAAALSHPNICTVFDVGREPPFIAMELVEGETLQQQLASGPLDILPLLDIGSAIADALATAHVGGVVHRDLKPANIVLSTRGPKVLDFGLATLISPESNQPGLTDSGATIGTVAYMSPEQLRGEHLDGRTDLFSLGVVLYEMATGQRPFAGATAASVSSAILHDSPDPPRRRRATLPARLDAIILRALEKDRESRYQSATDLHNDLERLRHEFSKESKPIAAPVTASRVGRVVSFALVASVVAGAVWFGSFRNRGASTRIVRSLGDLEVIQLTASGNAGDVGISPDGRYIAYVRSDGDAPSLWIRQTTTGSDAQILAGETNILIGGPTVTPDSAYVDFVRAQSREKMPSVWRVPFLGGTPRKLIPDVITPVGRSADGGQVAFVRVDDRFSDFSLVVADTDGGHERVLASRRLPSMYAGLFLPRNPMMTPAWSPDGRTIAVMGADEVNGNFTIQVVFVDVANGSERAVTLPSRGDAGGLAWLDDRSLVINQNANGSPGQLWQLSYPDGAISRLTNDLISYNGVSLTQDRSSLATTRIDRRVGVWVGDGRATSFRQVIPPAAYASTLTPSVEWAGERMLFGAATSGKASIVSVVPGRAVPEAIVFNGGSPASTTDGQSIVYVSGDTTKGAGLWKVDADGRRPIQLVTGNAWNPVLTDDDRRVLFLWLGAETKSGLFTVPIEGGQPTALVREAIQARSIDVARDGRLLFVMQDSRSGSSLVQCDLPACAVRRKLPLPANLGGRLRWTPDGRAVAYFSSGRDANNLWLQPLDGTPPRQITHFDDALAINDFAWSRDGRQLAIVRGSETRDVVMFKALQPAATTHP